MPGNDETPAWPSSDHDMGNSGSDEPTHEVAVPKVTLSQQPTLWVEKPGDARHPAPPQSQQGQQGRSPFEPRRAPQQPQGPPPGAQQGPPPQQVQWPNQAQNRGALPPQGPQPPQPAQPAQPVWPRPPQPPQQPQFPRQGPQPSQPPQPLQPPQPPQQQGQPPRRVEIMPAGAQVQPVRIEPADEQGQESHAQADRPDGATEADQTPPAEPPEGSTAAEPAEPKPGGKRKRLVFSGIAVLVVIAVGVTLALPYVSNRLGLPWAPNAPKGDPPEPLPVSLQLAGPDESAPEPSLSGIKEALEGPASASALGKLTGTVIDPQTKTVLWEKDGTEALTPASTTKLLTAAAALMTLDHGMQLSTKVVEGDEPGTVVLVAGGDVTLSSLPVGEDSIFPGAAHLDDLVEQVKEATGGSPVSNVRLDLSLFTGEGTAPGWAPEDVPSTYMAKVQPAMLDGGRSVATDGKSPGVADPAGRLASELAGRLGASVAADPATTAPSDAKVLGEVKSAPLTELVDQLLISSDNLLAEAVARQVAIAEGKEPSFAGAAEATKEVLARNGFDMGSVELSDGSGLSTLNKVPAKVLGDLLSLAADPSEQDPNTSKLRPMLGGLPVAGGSGTLASRYTEGQATEGRGWVRGKTGTLDGVNTLAGVVLDADGRVLVFALMSSGGSIEPARGALDDIAAALRGCGCR
ncbi:D-alanyl-D-alanine carboxypeptidase/D-alanyl-D-alanine-endopeptidase [Saccharomonospora sp. NPDC006951]